MSTQKKKKVAPTVIRANGEFYVVATRDGHVRPAVSIIATVVCDVVGMIDPGCMVEGVVDHPVFDCPIAVVAQGKIREQERAIVRLRGSGVIVAVVGGVAGSA